MKKVEIYTDGACSFNPGPGGWAAILIYKGVEKIISGNAKETTNNIMELYAVVKALSALKEKCLVKLYSDSAYVVNSVTEGWLDSWVKNGFKTADRKDVKNVDLWKELHELLKKHKVEFIKVKGHADNANNNRCDKIAREEISKII